MGASREGAYSGQGTYFFCEKQPNVPMELSFLIFTFLKKAHNENKVQVKMTGSRRLENGLVVPGSFLARMTSRAITTKNEEFMHSRGHKTTVFVILHYRLFASN